MRIVLALLLIAAAMIVGLWDVAAVYRGEPANTVSQTIYDWSAKFPILPFVVGVIVGHVFWPADGQMIAVRRP